MLDETYFTDSLIPPSGLWKAVPSNLPAHGFEMNLVFSATDESRACGDISGSGNDEIVRDWTKNGFYITGKWNDRTITFEKSYRCGKTVYYCGSTLLDNRDLIQGTYSSSSEGAKAGDFSMAFTNMPDYKEGYETGKNISLLVLR